VRLLFVQDHRELTAFLQLQEFNLHNPTVASQFHYRRSVFSSHLKSKCGNVLAKDASLRIILNIDGAVVVVRLFIGTQKRLVALHSALFSSLT
jgi:hypothetical protein